MPASECGRSTDRCFLEDFQTVTELPVKVAVQKQMTHFAIRYMGDIHRNVTHLSVEKLAFTGHDSYTAVLDKHITRNVTHMRPTRLERQLGDMNLEEQADRTRLGRNVVAQ